MFREWTQRVGSAVPRGFSRYYILQQLKEQPHTGKEIIDSAIEASAGNWKPSPGLIYPLLGRLLDEGLIEESENGKYQITDHGKTILTDLEHWKMDAQKQMDTMMRLMNMGKLINVILVDIVFHVQLMQLTKLDSLKCKLYTILVKNLTILNF